MKRLSLAGQVALIVAIAIFVVQFFNLWIAVDHRRDLAINNIIVPAAQRLVLASENPEFFDRREARRVVREDRRALDVERKRRAPRGPRVRIVDANPLPVAAERRPRLEAAMQERLERSGVAGEVRVGTVRAVDDRHSLGDLHFALQLDDGRWATLRTAGPPSMRPLVTMLTLQAILIGIAILIPTLLLLRRVGGSLRRLRDSALAFDGAVPGNPVTPAGPSDIRGLIEAVNAMQARIATMIGEKDVMLGAIGHDLRTPLTALRIEAEGVEDADQRSALVAQIEALHAQFEQILEFARTGQASTSRGPRDLAPLIEEIVSTYRDTGKEVALGPIEPLRARIDGAAITRALSNLIDNGLRYAGPVEVSLERANGNLRLIVADKGPGLSESDKATARSAFGRLDPSRNRSSGGHGLGLPIVEAIARAHGGKLLLEDNGPGLRAVIALPAIS